MFVRRADVVGVDVFVLVQGVVVRLAMYVDVAFQSLRYLLCRISVVAVTVPIAVC